MDPPSYILDPRFEVIGCAVKIDDQPSQWINSQDLEPFFAGEILRRCAPRDITTYAFNALFDNCILSWRYGLNPGTMLCTMRLAVALRGHILQSHSLREVARCLGLGEKGTAIAQARGKTGQALRENPQAWEEYKEYAINDNDLNYRILEHLMPEFSASEVRIMDKVLRCAVVPQFHIDKTMLEKHLAEVKKEKDDIMAEAGIFDIRDLRSTAKFEKLLKDRGVEIEYKPSATTPDAKIPAFAKTDGFMERLLNDPDPVVQALAAARLGVRSTIEETRGARMLNIANLNWGCYRPGNWMPVPLKYAGAHTHRLSGDWQINMQNLPSGRGQ